MKHIELTLKHYKAGKECCKDDYAAAVRRVRQTNRVQWQSFYLQKERKKNRVSTQKPDVNSDEKQ